MAAAPRTPPTALIESLNRTIGEILRPLLRDCRGVALLDFPNYSNVGDSAIWLGERRYLRRAALRTTYTCDLWTYSRERLAARISGRTILLSGGGNLGDLWPAHQQFREAVITAFPENRIVQLPQSIHFRDRANLARARAVFDAHPDLTLLVRDRRSLELSRSEFRTPSVLCPDMAFALGSLAAPGPPSTDVLWLSRTDIESAGGVPMASLPAGVEVTDWLDETPTLLARLNDWATEQLARHPRILSPLAAPLSATYEPLARQRVARGARLLGRGRVVITDRLHGHILSLLLGIPHVVLDNSYGKVRAFFETWTEGCDLAYWADSPQQGIETARSLVGALDRSAG